jgi:hypothetical protein
MAQVSAQMSHDHMATCESGRVDYGGDDDGCHRDSVRKTDERQNAQRKRQIQQQRKSS